MKKYIRKGFEDRVPQSKAQYILAWIKEGLFDNVFDAGDEFEEDVAYGTIIEVTTCKLCNGVAYDPDPEGWGEPCDNCAGSGVEKPAVKAEAGQTYQGCICPPTSEQTCMNSTCPRRNYYQPYQYTPVCPPPTIHHNAYPNLVGNPNQ